MQRMEMHRSDRIRLARRRAGLSQQALAQIVGVRRTAVSNWEARSGANPSSSNLERLACSLDVSHEWLATGRGEMGVGGASAGAAGPAPRPDDRSEQRLLHAWRGLPNKPRTAILELIEAYPRYRHRTPRPAR